VVRREQGCWRWSGYAIDRLTRLWIVLIPALLIGFVLDACGRWWLQAPVYFGTTGTVVIDFDVASRLRWSNFLATLLFLQDVVVEPFGSNRALWSLANEFWYYFWFPAFFLFLRRGVDTAGILVAAVLVGLSMFALWILVPGFLCWLVGAVVHFMSQQRAGAWRWTAWLGRRSALFLTGTVLAIVLAVIRIFRFTGFVPDFAVSLLFGAFLLAVLHNRGLPGVPGLGALARFGRGSSYSLYVTHLPLVTLVAGLLIGDARLLPAAWSFACILGLCALCVAWAALFSAMTERKTAVTRDYIRRFLVENRTQAQLKQN
jgi:peptidoglycan/LPS O-acetylase OafA/YrhL